MLLTKPSCAQGVSDLSFPHRALEVVAWRYVLYATQRHALQIADRTSPLQNSSFVSAHRLSDP